MLRNVIFLSNYSVLVPNMDVPLLFEINVVNLCYSLIFLLFEHHIPSENHILSQKSLLRITHIMISLPLFAK